MRFRCPRPASSETWEAVGRIRRTAPRFSPAVAGAEESLVAFRPDGDKYVQIGPLHVRHAGRRAYLADAQSRCQAGWWETMSLRGPPWSHLANTPPIHSPPAL